MTQPTPPGWYPDPSGAPGQRYWDGQQWGPTAPTATVDTPPSRSHKLRNALLIAAGVLVALIVIGIAAGGGEDDGSAPSAADDPSTTLQTSAPASVPTVPSAPTVSSTTTTTTTTEEAGGKQITYEVQSDGLLSTVTYFDELNNLTQLSDQSPNWSTSFEGKATFQMYSLSAQTKGEQVSCKITVDGNVVASESASGRYAVVVCASA